MRVHYGDGSTFEGWQDAPSWDVIAVSWPDERVGRDFCYGRSYFFLAPWMDGEPISADWGGLCDYLRGTWLEDVPLAELHPTDLIELGVKFGRTISTTDYHAIIRPLMKAQRVETVLASRQPERTLV